MIQMQSLSFYPLEGALVPLTCTTLEFSMFMATACLRVKGITIVQMSPMACLWGGKKNL